jgi:hypothetical protein
MERPLLAKADIRQSAKFQDDNGMTVSFTDVGVMPALAVFLSTSLSLIKTPMAPLVLF